MKVQIDLTASGTMKLDIPKAQELEARALTKFPCALEALPDVVQWVIYHKLQATLTIQVERIEFD